MVTIPQVRVSSPLFFSLAAPHRQKIFKIDDHMAIGISGLTADARVLADYMRNERLETTTRGLEPCFKQIWRANTPFRPHTPFAFKWEDQQGYLGNDDDDDDDDGDDVRESRTGP